MKRDCTNCARTADPTDPVHCGPCVFFPDARPPTNWLAPAPVSSARAPIHPTSAPYTDTQRLEWMLPLVSTLDDPTGVGHKRTLALAAALQLGKTGRDAVDFALEGSP